MENLKLNDASTFSKIEEFLKVTADLTRLKILYVLLEEELCVCRIQEKVEASQSLVSHQLAVLRKHDLVRSRKEGRHTYYALSDEHVKHLLQVVYEHVIEEKKRD